MDDRIRVLYVEDDSGFADLMAGLLPDEDGRFTVQIATDADEGLDRLDDTVDCVVSDYDMPDRNGIEFLRAVRAEYPDLPFVLFTGKGSEEIASEAISAGVTYYLQKSGGTEQFTILANRITNAVERHEAEQDRERHLKAIETAREAISILDDDGYFVYVNEEYADLYGYEPAEMVGEHWELIYPDGEMGFAREEILQTVAEQGVWHGESTGLRADGSTFREDHIVSQTDHGDLVCTVREVTADDDHAE